jgi:ABC-type nickel/cobalt efflux system permease component RcnA
MSRRLVAFLLTLCMCWQSLAFAGVGAVVASAEERVHQQLHFEDVAHHHDDHDHDDGGPHQDDSTASVTHVTLDAGLFAPALTSALILPLLQPCPERPLPAALPAHALPFLAGLERPPRLTA